MNTSAGEASCGPPLPAPTSGHRYSQFSLARTLSLNKIRQKHVEENNVHFHVSDADPVTQKFDQSKQIKIKNTVLKT